MPGFDVNSNVLVGRGLPNFSPEGALRQGNRAGRYLEQYSIPLLPNFAALVDEGSFYCTTNATPGTPANYAIQASFSATVVMFSIRNSDVRSGAEGGKRVYPAYIRIVAGATVPASATSAHYVITTDDSLRATAGTALTALNANLDTASISIADVRYTPTVAAASGSVRQIDRGIMRSVIPVANDEWVFVFGSVEMAGGISDYAGTTAKRILVPVPQVILGPAGNDSMHLHIWFPGTSATAGQFEYALGWYER